MKLLLDTQVLLWAAGSPDRLSRNLALGDLPALHKDPFDRMLLTQANVEGMPLLTVDEQVLQYREPVLKA